MEGGQLGEWGKGRGEGGGPLVTKERRRGEREGEDEDEGGEGRVGEDEPEVKRGWKSEARAVFGKGELPVLEKLDYEVSGGRWRSGNRRCDVTPTRCGSSPSHAAQISLPYPAPTGDDDDADPPPFLLRLEGSHVLQGLRAAVQGGYVDGGLPSWIGEVANEGRNALQIGTGGVQF